MNETELRKKVQRLENLLIRVLIQEGRCNKHLLKEIREEIKDDEWIKFPKI